MMPYVSNQAGGPEFGGAPHDEGEFVDVAQLRAIWRRRKWLGMGVMAAPLTLALSIIFFMPSVYEAKATLLVDRQQVPENFVQSTVTGVLETRLHTISQEILSRSQLEALIARFDLYPELRRRLSPDEVIDLMRAAIKLEIVDEPKGHEARKPRDTTVAFTIRYRGSDPEIAARVANTLAASYVDENLKVRERQAKGTALFLRTQLVETKKRLDEQERKVSEFRRQHLGELPEQLETNLAMLERLRLQLRTNADSQTRATERRSALTAQLAEASALVPPATTETPQARLARLRRELAQMRARYSAKYPDIVAAEAEIAELERQVEDGGTSGEGTRDAVPATPYVLRLREAIHEVEAEAKILKGDEARLRAEMASYQQRVENTPQREHEFKEAARDYETTRDVYQTLLKRNEEAQIAESMEQHQKGEQFRLLDRAIPPRHPIANRARLVLIATVLSLGLGVVAIVVAEYVDTSFHSADDLRAFTPVSVLVSVPWIVTDVYTRRKRMRARTAVALAALVLAVFVGGSYFVAHGNEQVVWLLSRDKS